jgi:hypothetical protein
MGRVVALHQGSIISGHTHEVIAAEFDEVSATLDIRCRTNSSSLGRTTHVTT